MNKQIIQLLRLANVAKKISFGDKALASIRKQKAKLVLISDMASENTKKKYNDKTNYYQITCYIVSDEIMQEVFNGKNVKVISIDDNGFALKLSDLLKG